VTTAATTNGHVIQTRGLTKRYGELRAVDAVNLEVRAGDVYGFLGANGSGKTTTVRMLLGLVLPTSGEAEVLGMPMPAARRTPCGLPAPLRQCKPWPA
jgi:ABC-type multidrug transport system ATPase subunit